MEKHILYIQIAIFLSHFIGDFVLQSDKMSKQKSKDIKVLLIHVLILTCSILVGLLLFVFAPAVINGFSKKLNLFFIIVSYSITNGLFHLLIDYFTSKWTSKLWGEGKVHEFFVVIGFDQFLHALCYLLFFTRWF